MKATEQCNYHIYAVIGYSISEGKQNNRDNFHLHDISLNSEIELIPFKDLAAVVSTTRLIDYDQLDKKALSALVDEHQRVNIYLMNQYNIIPMRFGMIVQNKDEIRDVLQKAYIQFQALLKRVCGKSEFIVEVIWDKNLIFQNIIKNNVTIQALQKEIVEKGAIAGLPIKIKLGKCIFEELELTRKTILKDIIHHLTSEYPDFTAGKLLDVVQSDATTNLEMIMNYSFLLDKSKENAFESTLNLIAEKYDDSLKFKLIGPMPPFSFTPIELSRGNFELVDESRKLFGLENYATLQEIKRAYYTLAGQFHPDKFENESTKDNLDNATEKMKKIVIAKDILFAYCNQLLTDVSFLNNHQLKENEPLFSFKKDDVESALFSTKHFQHDSNFREF